MNDELAQAAIAKIRDGMVVGLGTGRAASRCIRALAERRPDVVCVATSVRSYELAESLGLNVQPFAEHKHVDFLFDGADEVDPELNMIKGAGGAMTREKMVARVSEYCLYVIDESKLVERLGQKKPLPIEFLAFGEASILNFIAQLNMQGSVRVDENGARILTDEGNPVFDAIPGDHDLTMINTLLDVVPGIVGHGLFMGVADEILVEMKDGSIVQHIWEEECDENEEEYDVNPS